MGIIIFSKDGSQLASVTVASSSMLVTQIMSDNYLQIDFESGDYIDIKRDAYIIYEGVKYTLRRSVSVEKISTCEYKYTARFDAPQELLENIIMSHMAGENQIKTKSYERNFSIAGTAKEHLEMLWRNTARLKINFLPVEDGDIDPSLTGVKVVAYNVVSCKSALQLIANAFECEWWVDGNETNGYKIHLGKCSFDEDAPTPIAYGFDKGVLPNAKRDLHKDSQRMTHICVQGGSQNINTLSQIEDMPKYGFSTLHLPKLSNERNGKATIYYDVRSNKFEGETGFSMTTAVMLTIDRDANTMTSSLFNEDEDMVVERAYDMSEFYPQKTRTTTAFGFQNNNTEFYVEDNGIEQACDYKKYQLGGEKITIVFQSGALAGKTFDVINYDHAKKRFECAITDYDTIAMPSVDEEMWRPNINDTFIVYGTALPLTYFSDMSTDPFSGAEWDMCRRCASILCENFEDKFAYAITVDGKWMSVKTSDERNKLKAGYWVHYTDNQLCGGGIDIRITGMKKYLTRPLEPELTIGDEVKTYSVAQKLQQVQSSVSATYNYVTQVQEQTQKEIEQVAKGADGKDAGFGNVTASVDDNVGIPSVIVTTSGDNTAKNFSFAFHNLKGATGQAGKDGVDGKDGKDGIDGSFYIDTTYVEDPSDERVPSTKLFADQINLLLTVGVPLVVSGRLADYYTKSEINTKLGDYVTSSDLSANYYNKTYLNAVLKALQDSIPTKTSQLTNDSNFATETWVTNKGYVTSTTLTTELAKKADAVHYHDNIVNLYESRPSTANIQKGDGRLYQFKATSSMLEGKPNFDGHILHLGWDNSGGYDNQLFIPNVFDQSNRRLGFRGQGKGSWGDWFYCALTTDIPTNVSQLNNDVKYVNEATIENELSAKEDKRQRWVVGQQSVWKSGYQVIAILSIITSSNRDYEYVIRITGIHTSAQSSNLIYVGGCCDSTSMGTPSKFEYLLGSSVSISARLFKIDDNHIALAIKRTNQYARYSCEVIDVQGYGSPQVEAVLNGDSYADDAVYLKEISRNVALLTDLAKKEDKHDYILMYYDYRKQYSVQHSSGFTNVEVISELSIRIRPAGCTNKNEMRAYLLNHQIQMKQMKRNASNDTIEVRYDAIYQYTVTDSDVQIGINGSSILSPVAGGEIVYYQFCIQKMSYE